MDWGRGLSVGSWRLIDMRYGGGPGQESWHLNLNESCCNLVQ